jgi:hypothetical protein
MIVRSIKRILELLGLVKTQKGCAHSSTPKRARSAGFFEFASRDGSTRAGMQRKSATTAEKRENIKELISAMKRDSAAARMRNSSVCTYYTALLVKLTPISGVTRYCSVAFVIFAVCGHRISQRT